MTADTKLRARIERIIQAIEQDDGQKLAEIEHRHPGTFKELLQLREMAVG